ncbi:hypothetical protein WMY93_026254 [Mugilogobius chulae]|uniref:Uncharacterized protein n=1 Tax=Mugilogobius chulae TaxID=88201 RepID=A0AAW0N6Y2_9GOBI
MFQKKLYPQSGEDRPQVHLEEHRQASGASEGAQTGLRRIWTSLRCIWKSTDRPQVHLEKHRPASGASGEHRRQALESTDGSGASGEAQTGLRCIWRSTDRPQVHLEEHRPASGASGEAQTGLRCIWRSTNRPQVHLEDTASGAPGRAQTGLRCIWRSTDRPQVHLEEHRPASGASGGAQTGLRCIWRSTDRPQVHLEEHRPPQVHLEEHRPASGASGRATGPGLRSLVQFKEMCRGSNPKPDSSVKRSSELSVDFVEELHGFTLNAVKGQSPCAVVQVNPDSSGPTGPEILDLTLLNTNEKRSVLKPQNKAQDFSLSPNTQFLPESL